MPRKVRKLQDYIKRLDMNIKAFKQLRQDALKRLKKELDRAGR